MTCPMCRIYLMRHEQCWTLLKIICDTLREVDRREQGPVPVKEILQTIDAALPDVDPYNLDVAKRMIDALYGSNPFQVIVQNGELSLKMEDE